MVVWSAPIWMNGISLDWIFLSNSGFPTNHEWFEFGKHLWKENLASIFSKQIQVKVDDPPSSLPWCINEASFHRWGGDPWSKTTLCDTRIHLGRDGPLGRNCCFTSAKTTVNIVNPKLEVDGSDDFLKHFGVIFRSQRLVFWGVKFQEFWFSIFSSPNFVARNS